MRYLTVESVIERRIVEHYQNQEREAGCKLLFDTYRPRLLHLLRQESGRLNPALEPEDLALHVLASADAYLAHPERQTEPVRTLSGLLHRKLSWTLQNSRRLSQIEQHTTGWQALTGGVGEAATTSLGPDNRTYGDLGPLGETSFLLTSPEEQVRFQQLRQGLERCLEKLPSPTDREDFLRHVLKGVTLQRLARERGASDHHRLYQRLRGVERLLKGCLKRAGFDV
ncbi:MAG: hypothetical protein ACKO6N_05465 [Myxococcota bacterium]